MNPLGPNGRTPLDAVTRMNIDDLGLMTRDKHLADTAALRNDLLEAQATIEKLKRELSNTVAIAQQDLAVAERRHAEDIKLIGDQLIEEAEERDLCEAYDDVIRTINGNLHVKLREREQEYEVTLRIFGNWSAMDGDTAGKEFMEHINKALKAAGIHNVEITVYDTSC